MDTSISVLVVDDSSTMSAIISDMLRKLGYADIDVARDGQSALELMSMKRYGLVLSDWEMQPMGGEELVKSIRRNRTTGRTPIIMITATTSRGSSWLAGANAFLSKPFGQDDLRTAIKSASSGA